MAHGGGLALRRDVLAGSITVVVTVLLGAPVGLLWAALAPEAEVVVHGTRVDVVETYGDAFIAADAAYLAVVVVAGTVSGLLAWCLAAAHSPAVVVGLTVGGLAAAWVAAAVGEQVGRTALELAGAGVEGPRELAVRLRSTSAVVGWPLASLAAYVGALLSAERRSAVPAGPGDRVGAAASSG